MLTLSGVDLLAVARALHVLAVVHWIGGVSLITLVLLPGITRHVPAVQRLALFELVERRVAFQARITTLVAGLTGFYMTRGYRAWDRFADPAFWWMHAMVLVWAIFMVVLFIAEPLFLHKWFHERAVVSRAAAGWQDRGVTSRGPIEAHDEIDRTVRGRQPPLAAHETVPSPQKAVEHARSPVEIRSFPVSVFWHRRNDADPRIGWMRQQVTLSVYERRAEG